LPPLDGVVDELVELLLSAGLAALVDDDSEEPSLLPAPVDHFRA
jgi:hypothetical protein